MIQPKRPVVVYRVGLGARGRVLAARIWPASRAPHRGPPGPSEKHMRPPAQAINSLVACCAICSAAAIMCNAQHYSLIRTIIQRVHVQLINDKVVVPSSCSHCLPFKINAHQLLSMYHFSGSSPCICCRGSNSGLEFLVMKQLLLHYSVLTFDFS
jgi:hypothetical protein